jgi:cytochrome P450
MLIDAAARRVSLDPKDAGFRQDPYPAYHAIRAAAPAFFWQEYGFWCFCAYADVNALLRDRRFGREILHVATREELGWPQPDERLAPFLAVERHSMLEREPPVHTRLRTLVNRAFVSRQVERLRPRIEALANQLIDGLRPGCDLIAAYATPIPVVVIAELLGVPVEMAPSLLDWSHRMVAMYQFDRSRAAEDSAVAATEAFVAFLRAYVAKRRGEPADDLISLLIAAEASGERLAEDELIASCILLLNAGHEATVHAIGNGVKSLLEAAVDPAHAFGDAAATEATVEEVLRFDAPLHLFTRYALEDVEYEGVALKRGDRVGLMLGAANRDPARFEEPDRLWPERPRVPLQSFGGGIHFCIGAPLARLEMQVALPLLFARLPGLRLAGTPRYRDTYHFRGLEALHVEW